MLEGVFSFLKSVDRRFYVFAAAWATVQLALVLVFFNAPMGNDALGYEGHAIQSYSLGTIYPSQANLYDTYVQGPGLVNALIPFYAIFGNVRVFMFMELLMNVCILFEILYIGFRLFSRRTGYIAAVAYALLLSNIFAATQINTEVLYLFLAITAFCLSLNRRLWLQGVVGLLYAAAWTVRPLVLAFVVASIVFYICKRCQWLARCVLDIAFLALPLVLLGAVNERRIGTPLVSSSTGGYNLLMTAWDGATPLPNHSIYLYEDGLAHKDIVERLTFYERDKKWRTEAIALIEEHPLTYLKLCVERVIVMWNKDTWDIPNLLGNFDNPVYATRYGLHDDFVIYQIVRMLYSLAFYIVCICAIVGIARFRKQIFTLKGTTLVVLLLGISGTCLLPMEQRLHYPYVWVVCLWAAMEIDRILSNKSRKAKNA